MNEVGFARNSIPFLVTCNIPYNSISFVKRPATKTGLISAILIVRRSALEWPTPEPPQLPLEETALNTVALLLSGVMLFVSNRGFKVERASAGRPLVAAIGLGAFFVVFQGYEWVALIGQGLTLTSSQIGS